MSVPLILGGAVVTEKIFNLPGMAQLSLQAAEQHDVPVVQGTLLVTVAVVVVANLAVNAALTALNPAAVRRTGPGKARGVGKTRGAGRARGAEGAPRAGRPGRLVRVTGARHGSTPGEGSTS